MKIGVVFALGIFALATAASGQQILLTPRYASNPARISTVTAQVSSTSYTIPANFVGFSVEVGDLINGLFQGTTGANSTWIGMANLLGSNGVLRIGGGSSDPVTPPALTSNIATNLATFVSSLGSGWSVIYGLDFTANDATTAANQANMVATALGVNNVTFQFGNEQDAAVSQSTYVSRWNTYYSSVSSSVAGAKFGAPDVVNFAHIQSYSTGLTLSPSQLQFLSGHYYNNCGTGYNYGIPDVVNMINKDQTPLNPVGYFAGQDTYANNNNVQLRMSESNNCSNGGTTGLSDVVASATWYLNEAIALANAGWSGINTHNAYSYYFPTTKNGYYNSIYQFSDNNFGAGPEFYGMLLFSKIEGQQVVSSSIGGNANVNAISTLRTSGKANILIVNNDTMNSSAVTPQQSAIWTTATVLLFDTVDGAACSSKKPRLGGAVIGEGGSWSGTTYSIANGQSILLPPCGAALVSIQ